MRLTRRLAAIVLALYSVGLTACTGKPGVPEFTEISLRDPAGHVQALQVEIADTPAEQERGLMGRKTVEQGMLFVFPDEAVRTFWMENTLVPLDIIFFDAAGQYVSSTRMEPCTGDPCPTYASKGPAKFALEMDAGRLIKLDARWSISVR